MDNPLGAKIADICTSESSSGSNVDRRVIQKGNKCVCCCKPEQELHIALQELSSARKIIQILQEEDPGTASTKEANSNHDLNFETANTKLTRKKLTSNKRESNNILEGQQSHSVHTCSGQ